jgi:uncharacterized protein (TIGR00251 family)
VSEPGSFFTSSRGGLLVRLLATPRAGRDRIEGVRADAEGQGVLKVAVTAAPEGGKANQAIVKLLAKAWRLPKSDLRIRAGATARRKTVFVEGDPGTLARRLSEWGETNA